MPDAQVKEKPDYVDAYVNIGVALARQGSMNKAIKLISRALVLSPTDEKALRYLELARSKLSAEDNSISR